MGGLVTCFLPTRMSMLVRPKKLVHDIVVDPVSVANHAVATTKAGALVFKGVLDLIPFQNAMEILVEHSPWLVCCLTVKDDGQTVVATPRTDGDIHEQADRPGYLRYELISRGEVEFPGGNSNNPTDGGFVNMEELFPPTLLCPKMAYSPETTRPLDLKTAVEGLPIAALQITQYMKHFVIGFRLNRAFYDEAATVYLFRFLGNAYSHAGQSTILPPIYKNKDFLSLTSSTSLNRTLDEATSSKNSVFTKETFVAATPKAYLPTAAPSAPNSTFTSSSALNRSESVNANNSNFSQKRSPSTNAIPLTVNHILCLSFIPEKVKDFKKLCVATGGQIATSDIVKALVLKALSQSNPLTMVGGLNSGSVSGKPGERAERGGSLRLSARILPTAPTFTDLQQEGAKDASFNGNPQPKAKLFSLRSMRTPLLIGKESTGEFNRYDCLEVPVSSSRTASNAAIASALATATTTGATTATETTVEGGISSNAGAAYAISPRPTTSSSTSNPPQTLIELTEYCQSQYNAVLKDAEIVYKNECQWLKDFNKYKLISPNIPVAQQQGRPQLSYANDPLAAFVTNWSSLPFEEVHFKDAKFKEILIEPPATVPTNGVQVCITLRVSRSRHVIVANIYSQYKDLLERIRTLAVETEMVNAM